MLKIKIFQDLILSNNKKLAKNPREFKMKDCLSKINNYIAASQIGMIALAMAFDHGDMQKAHHAYSIMMESCCLWTFTSISMGVYFILFFWQLMKKPNSL